MSLRGAGEWTRFWSKVEVTGTCWLWTAAKTDGYGVFTRDGGKSARAHRVAYELLMGEAPADALDHVCRVRHCVNPDHLEVVTTTENNQRTTGFRVRRDRCPKGHLYSENGRLQAGYPVCQTCDTERHQNRRKVLI